MASKRAKIDLSDQKKRDALPVRSSYYAHSLGSKRYVLLRKSANAQSWGARVPGHPDRVIGPLDEMTFDDAAQVVRDMAQEDTSQPDALRTIGDALDDYETACAKTKTTQQMAVIRSHLKAIEPLREELIASGSKAVLNRWRTGLITTEGKRPRGPQGANKVLGTLKAALNAEGIDGPWQKLAKFKERDSDTDAEAAVLTPEQIGVLLAKAEETDPDLYSYLKGLWLLGCRPSELRTAPKTALSGSALTLVGKTGKRHITLTPGVAQWLADHARTCNTHLVEIDGKPFERDAFRYRWKRLVDACGDDLPDGVVMYSIRHSYITQALYAGVPIFATARHCGTSSNMIEKVYGHVIAGLQAEAFEAMESLVLK